MKYLRLFSLAALFAFVSLGVSAQKPGYTRYVITKTIDKNGNVSSGNGGAGYWIKFENNLIWLDMGFGSQSRYIYNSTRSDGNKLYYLQAWNHGTMNQGSGWMTFYDSYLLVSADRTLINQKSNYGTSVLRLQTANDVGGMIE